MKKIGIDFDNTIVDYNHLFLSAAKENGYIDNMVTSSKKNIRDTIRKLPDGEMKWQQLQAVVYSRLMTKAKLIDGVTDFLAKCQQLRAETFIVSHKTKTALRDPQQNNLHQLSRSWLDNHEVTSGPHPYLSHDQIFFEDSRTKKIARIKELECNYFIDDLEEIFFHPDFPANTTKILFSNTPQSQDDPDVNVFANWKLIEEFVFPN